MLIVLVEEHRKNFRRLVEGASALEAAHVAGTLSIRSQENLLRFYAAEVGLKFLLNSVQKVPFKHEISNKSDPHVEKYSHKLQDMVSDLKIPASRISAPPPTQMRCIGGFNGGAGGQQFQLQSAHEAWRYGLTIEPNDEAAISSYLAAILSYLSQEIAP